MDSVVVNDDFRRFSWYAPDRLEAGAALIVVLHGAGMSGLEMREATGRGFERVEAPEGVVVAYPDGYERTWNDCRSEAPYPAVRRDVDDAAFLDSLVAALRDRYALDQDRLYVVGFSNGGGLAYRLAREDPQGWAGFAAIAANLPVPREDGCGEAIEPVSVLVMNGTADPVVPYAGGVASARGVRLGRVLSTEATVGAWLGLDGCLAPPEVAPLADVDPDDGSRIRLSEWTCPADRRVSLATVEGGGHTIPGPGPFDWPAWLGPVNRDVDAASLVWTFFRSLAR
jgi:polyhydroxybutyrate depolymerase